jgi:hypothetical protein
MTTKTLLGLALASAPAWLSTLNPQLAAAPLGTAFTYQGRLASGTGAATGLFDFSFSLYDAPSGPTQLGATLTNNAVPVTDGYFTVELDFGSAFDGNPRWLDISVKTNGADSSTPLAPRQALKPAPYALCAGTSTDPNLARLTVPNTAQTATATPQIVNGFIVGVNLISGGSGYVTAPLVTISGPPGTGANVTANIAGGAVVSFNIVANGSGYPANTTVTIGPPPSNAYQTFPGVNYFTGVNSFNNAGNTFSGSFNGAGAGLTALNAGNLGSGTVPDARLAANVARTSQVWLLNGNSGTTSANYLGTANSQPLELKVNASRALRLEPTAATPNLIGGYSGNVVSNGVVGATIGGGGLESSVNTVGANYATVVGGHGNTASGLGSTVIGAENTASGSYSIAIGVFNVATNRYAMAAGYRAQAIHQGAFVWADSQNLDFASTADDTFIVRAAGGVGINRNDPRADLHVGGTVEIDQTLSVGGTVRIDAMLSLTRTTLTPTEGSTITPASSYLLLNPAAAVTLSATTALANGTHTGDIVILQGNNDVHTVTVPNNANTKLGAARTLGNHDMLMLMWDLNDWLEISYTDNVN